MSNFTRIVKTEVNFVWKMSFWNLTFIFSGSRKKFSLVLLQIPNYIYSPWKTNLWMKLPTIPPGLTGKIVKYRPFSEPIRLPDSARSQAWKELRQGAFSPWFLSRIGNFFILSFQPKWAQKMRLWTFCIEKKAFPDYKKSMELKMPPNIYFFKLVSP